MSPSPSKHKQKKDNFSSKTALLDEKSNWSLEVGHLSSRKGSKCRVALVCDWLTTPGGAEKVLLELHRLYPDAPIYTSQYSKKGINWFDDADVRTGWLQIFPKFLRKFLGPLRQIYFSHLDLTDYDLVISVTGAEAKSVRTTFHLCYCHVPTQYYWQMYDKYVENPGFGFLNPLVRFAFKLLVKPLRRADYRAAQQPDQFITISDYAREQIQQYYHRDAIVIPPPVEVDKFAPRQPSTPQDYFVIACRQVTWKRVDLAIRACQLANVPLLVIGDGPEHANLVKLARETSQNPETPQPSDQLAETSQASEDSLIKFLPWTPTDKLAHYLQSARAYLFPSLEPFGIAAVEALAAGCPVIAYTAGGSRDFIKTGQNGLLFDAQTPESLAAAIREFQQLSFDRKQVSASAQAFSTQHFDESVTTLVNKIRKENL